MCPAHYEQQRTRLKAYGRWENSYIPSEPVREHILELRSAGIGNKRLSKLCGVSHNTIQVILTGRPDRGTGPSKTVLRRTAEKILAVPVPATPHVLVSPGVKVSAVGTRRRLQALVALGYSRSELCRQLGIQVSNGHRIFMDDHLMVLASTARAVAELFNRLQLTPGSCSRALNEGRRRGWALPLAWDEDTIDDPNAVPEVGTSQSRAPIMDRVAELEFLNIPRSRMPELLGIAPESLERALSRHGLKEAV